MHSYSNSLKNHQTSQNSKHSTYADLFAAGQPPTKLDSPGMIGATHSLPWNETHMAGGQTSSSSHSNYASHAIVETPPSTGLAHQPQLSQQHLQQQQQQPGFIADQICRMINGKLSLTHNQNTPIPLGNLQDTLFNSEYLSSQHIRPNEYFDSVQRLEKDSKLQSQQQQQQQMATKKTKQIQQQQTQTQQHQLAKEPQQNNFLSQSQKAAIQSKPVTSTKDASNALKPKKQLTINTAEVQSTYNFPHYSAHHQHENTQSLSNQIAFNNPRTTVSSAKPNGSKNAVLTPSASQKYSSVAIVKTTKNNVSAPSGNPHLTSNYPSMVPQSTAATASTKAFKLNNFQPSVSGAITSMPLTSQQSAIMKQLSPKYQQQIKFYDGVQGLFSSQQQPHYSQQLQQSNSQSPNEKQKHNNSTSPPTELFFLSPNHPKSQPQSTKSLAKTAPKYFEFPPSSSQIVLNRNATTTHQTPSQKQSNNLQPPANQKTKAPATSNAQKNMSINLILQKQQINSNESEHVPKNPLTNFQNIASAKLAAQQQQKQTFQLSSTRDSSEVVMKLQQQSDLNAIFQRTSAVLRNFQQEKELWGEEKNMLINEILTLRSRISFYQDSCNQQQSQQQQNHIPTPPVNTYFQDRNLDFND